MAKKSRRARRQGRATAQPVRISQSARAEIPSAASQDVDFAEEYHYVVEDLRRIALIAFVLMALLVALALIIG
jgi:hypothetical protein